MTEEQLLKALAKELRSIANNTENSDKNSTQMLFLAKSLIYKAGGFVSHESKKYIYSASTLIREESSLNARVLRKALRETAKAADNAASDLKLRKS